MTHWWEHGNIWFGSGMGSARAIIPYIQRRFEIDTDGHTFYWLHSDILQCAFELGIVGLVAFAVLFYYALRHSHATPWLFSALCGWLATAAANYPARMAFHGLVGVFLVAYALTKSEDEL